MTTAPFDTACGLPWPELVEGSGRLSPDVALAQPALGYLQEKKAHMDIPTQQNRSNPDRVLSVVIGVYGSLWGVIGLLALVFGLVNITAEGLGGLAALIILFGVALPALLFAMLALVCTVGLWQGRRWSRSATTGLVVVHLLGALFLFANQFWVLGLIGVVLSAAVWWYLRRSSR